MSDEEESDVEASGGSGAEEPEEEKADDKGGKKEPSTNTKFGGPPRRDSRDTGKLTEGDTKFCPNCICKQKVYFRVSMGYLELYQRIEVNCKECNLTLYVQGGEMDFDEHARPDGGRDKNKKEDAGSGDGSDDDDAGGDEDSS